MMLDFDWSLVLKAGPMPDVYVQGGQLCYISKIFGLFQGELKRKAYSVRRKLWTGLQPEGTTHNTLCTRLRYLN